jgi:ferredoxin
MSPNQEPPVLQPAKPEPQGDEPADDVLLDDATDEIRLPVVEPEPLPVGRVRNLPVLPPPRPSVAKKIEGAAIRELRRFHVVGPESQERPREFDFLPALMFLFRDPSKVRTKYPLYVYPSSAADPQNLFDGIGVWLERAVRSFAPEPGGARILEDNLPRLELHIRRAVGNDVEPQPAPAVFERATTALVNELQLEGAAAEELLADLARLLNEVHPQASLLGLSEAVPMFLFMQAVRTRLPPRHLAFRQRVRRLLTKLQDLLRLEFHKSAESRSGEALSGALGGVAGAFLDPGALGGVMGAPRGSERMRPRRRQRIEKVIEVLEAYLATDATPVVTVVHPKEMAASWLRRVEGVRVIHHSDPARIASDVFDEAAEKMAELIWAARVAELEVEDEYEPICHSPILYNLRWQDFGPEELRLLPPVVAMVTARTLPDRGMTSLSRLLLSGRPVQVLATVQSAGTPGGTQGQGPFSGFRLELGYLGVSHREAMVEQSSAARPAHLVESLRRGLDASRPSLHVIASGLTFGGRMPRLGAWLHGGAAIESRAHPFFRYDPEKGESWAQRFNFDGNTQPLRDWPVYELPCRAHDGSSTTLTTAFTFADYALLEPVYQGHFQPVSAECPEDDLVSVDAWVDLEREELARKVPTIWAVDAEQRLHRLAITRRLALACKDRQGFWRTLQEMAGINNEYAHRAAEAARKQALERAQRELAAREAELLAEIQRVREEEAAEALGRLASALLHTELTAPASGGVAPRAAATSSAAPAAGEASAPEARESEPALPDEDDGLSFDEPYIDTPLCTSCNECTALNGQLFVYNANKQAYIGDPQAGTFHQLVEAAEKCPARCIHPGKPQNPGEPGLDDLIARAAKFN